MSSLIEQAAARLEQLRNAGVEVPQPASPFGVHPAASAATMPPTVAANAPSAAVVQAPATEAAPTEVPVAARPAAPSVVSRTVELDLAAIAAAGIVTPAAPRSHIADQYRVIKRPLIRNAMGRGAEPPVAHGNLIMVTSAMAGEGKSFTSINLAMSIATELDLTVMLIDADVARPSMLRMLGLPPGPGLLEVLEGKVDLPSVLLKTNIEKLTLLPSGSHHHRATELLASESMRAFLNDIANRYPDRIIIFDSPPLLLTTEARVLASSMGQIVIVVHAEKTLQTEVQAALATIESCPVKLLLMNQARTNSDGGYGYGYGYGYGHGYGYGYGADQAQPEAPAS